MKHGVNGTVEAVGAVGALVGASGILTLFRSRASVRRRQYGGLTGAQVVEVEAFEKTGAATRVRFSVDGKKIETRLILTGPAALTLVQRAHHRGLQRGFSRKGERLRALLVIPGGPP